MSRIATVLLIAAAPVLADSTSQLPKSTVEYSFAAPNAKCYFIRQANKQLQPPLENPQMMRIATLEKIPSVAPRADCMPEQGVIKVVTRE